MHLLPAFDIASVNEDKTTWQSVDEAAMPALPPDSRPAAGGGRRPSADQDGFNWGYDPYHYTAPEGSYATDPQGTARIREFRQMVQALNAAGLRVVMDVVYNHTNASGQDDNSVLDKIVPGYYHRLDADGRGGDQHLLPEHRHRARHDGKADDRLAGDLGHAVQGGRLPLRPDGPPHAVEHAEVRDA